LLGNISLFPSVPFSLHLGLVLLITASLLDLSIRSGYERGQQNSCSSATEEQRYRIQI